MGSITALDKTALEKEWAAAEARKRLLPEDRARFSELRYTVRPQIYFDKILIVWSLRRGQPQIKDIFSVTSLDGSFSGGLWVKARSKVTNEETTITHQPRRLAPGLDVFAWLPFFNELRYTSEEWHNHDQPRNLRLSACFKMADDPNQRLRESLHYLSELHVFREKFPQYADTRF